MGEMRSLIEALGQYNKNLARQYKIKLNKKGVNIDSIKNELIHEIKKHRWQISDGKKQDFEFSKHFERYFVDKEDR